MNRIYALAIGISALLISPVHAADAVSYAAPTFQPVNFATGTASSNWDGFYAGVSGGYAWGEMDDVGSGSEDIEGWLGGVQAGYNVNMGGFVLGAEADYQLSGVKLNETVGGDEFSAGVNHFGTLRGRVGAELGGIMPYVTGGLAFGELGYSIDDGTGASFSESEYGWGWTAGAGVEAMVTSNLSLKAEYLYTDFRGFELGGMDVNSNMHAARAGLNFHF